VQNTTNTAALNVHMEVSKPTQHMDASLQTKAILSRQNKFIHLFPVYTLTGCWEQGSERVEGSSVTQFKFGVSPHRNTRTGNDAMKNEF
jgi:hypothetical protein